MIQYVQSQDRPSIFPAIKPSSKITAPTTKSNDDVVKSFGSGLTNRYFVWRGESKVGEEHHFFDFRKPEFTPEGEPLYLTPKITTFYGHDLMPPQGITIIPIARSHKTALLLITLHRLDGNADLEMTVTAWQGDNDTLHLISPLPSEDEYLGVDHAHTFGKKSVDTEKRDYLLARLWYGDTAVLDADIAEFITPGKILRA